ncbi:MAG: hypothetical protein DWQ19_09250 [Crenarchaeota archaeon]|nr:MAG: hypothetical protein DWQ19_09250 [Thermoproteota archaeon]
MNKTKIREIAQQLREISGELDRLAAPDNLEVVVKQVLDQNPKGLIYYEIEHKVLSYGFLSPVNNFSRMLKKRLKSMIKQNKIRTENINDVLVFKSN